MSSKRAAVTVEPESDAKSFHSQAKRTKLDNDSHCADDNNFKLAQVREQLSVLTNGLPLDPLPSAQDLDALDVNVPHAPTRTPCLSAGDFRLAVENALRYFPPTLHELLAPEFAQELRRFGHIYMYRFRPRPPFANYAMRAHPVQAYPAKCQQAACIMMMIQNNLDPDIAQFPHELITYGGNGTVLSNWAQYHLLMYYLSTMTDQQTLSMYSGHPAGLFPSHRHAPRLVLTNGMVIPNYSSKELYERMSALGVTMYGQMTAGSYCYIGPQGIVHGTTITVLNAGRKYLGVEDLSGKVFVTSGLGGMSGAQAKAGVIAGCIAVVAEVDRSALMKRYEQGWVQEYVDDLDACVQRIKCARAEKKPLSLAYHGNVVSLWQRLAQEDELLVELGSDQTSLHNPFNGGYYPVQLSFEESNKMMADDPTKFKHMVQESLRLHVEAVNRLTARGMRFWDYGNSFLLEASRAGADICAEDVDSKAGANTSNVFRYPSYVQDIMGDIFSLGFGPFRWVCASGLSEDLALTDEIAASIIRKLRKDAPPRVLQQYNDNLKWVEQAGENKLVVGSQARILYADMAGRRDIALAFNEAIRDGRLHGPVILSRDHHDVSGTDSPYRETSNITDGSAFCADMAIQNVIGDSFRRATWVAIHNGGGVGWGEVTNGGFGLVLDGSDEAGESAHMMLTFDVSNGVNRRAWARNDNAIFAVKRAMEQVPNLKVTLPHLVETQILDSL
jgi:urocanate hydratase